MAKTKDFCPVGKNGKLLAGKTIESDKDFDGFVQWMGRAANESLRKKAYEALAPDGVASIEAKAALIDQVAGNYVSRLLRQANRQAIWGLSSDVSESDKADLEVKVGEARARLKDFCDTIKTELFTGQMKRSEMSEASIDRLLSSFSKQDDMTKSVSALLAANVKALGENAKAELPGIIRSHIESPSRRADITREYPTAEAGEEFDAKLGVFAPLIRFIEQSVDPSIRMEMLAQLEDYVRSGWYAKDHIDEETGPGCELGLWWGASHDSAPAMRALFKKVEEGKPVSGHELTQAFATRISELVVSPVVKTKKNRDHAKSIFEISSLEHLNPQEAFGNLGRAGRPDSFWISPESDKMFITCATADETMSRQNDQMARYYFAISNALKSEKFCGLQRPSGVEPQLFVRSMALCSAQTQKASAKGVQAGQSLVNCFEVGGGADKRKLVEILNVLPFLAVFSDHDDIFKPETLSAYSLDLTGATESVWSPMRARIAEAPEEKRKTAALLELSKAFAKVGDLLERAPLKEVVFGGVGALGSKAYEGISALRKFTSLVSRLYSEADPSDAKAMRKNMAKHAGVFKANMIRLSEAANRDNKTLLREIVSIMDQIESDSKPTAARKIKKA